MQRTSSHRGHRALWSSPAGKARVAQQLAALLPNHTTYVEPFAGSAAVLFAKEPSPTEVISDVDPEITAAFKAARDLDDEGLERLSQADWVGNRATFDRLAVEKGGDVVDGLRRFLYLSQFSFLRRRRHFSPAQEGARSQLAKRLVKSTPRLKNVVVEAGDYEAVVRKYDAPDTLFFFDPPYVGSDGGVGEKTFDESRFMAVLKSLKGKFLLTYGSGGSVVQQCRTAGFCVQQHFIKRNTPVASSATGRPTLTTYIIANYDLPAASKTENQPFEKVIPLLKRATEERYALGIVLEPDVVDAHNHVYGVEDVRKAAHSFMQHQVVGVMHQSTWKRVDVELLECYVMPADAVIDGQTVRKGTWMLALRVNDDDVWERVRDGELTGLSITGFATCTPLNPRLSTERSSNSTIYALTDFEVSEVHLVDLAANKRRFTVTKRSLPLAENDASANCANDDQNVANEDGGQSAEAPTGGAATTKETTNADLPFLREVAYELRAAVKSLADIGLNLAQKPSEAPLQAANDDQEPVRAEVVKSLTQRVVHLEKQLPLPASESPERGEGPKSHVWPFDINRSASGDGTARDQGGRA